MANSFRDPSYEAIVAASDAFFNTPGLNATQKDIPTCNRVRALVATGAASAEEVAKFAAGVHSIIHPEVSELCREYLEQRKYNGTEIERRVFTAMDLSAFLERLLTKRPFMFMGASDAWVLRDGSMGYGFWEELHHCDPEPLPWVEAPWGRGMHWARALDSTTDGNLKVRWEYDGQEATVPVSQVTWHGRPLQLTMDQYLSYPELQLSALLSVVVPTHFVNDGKRDNYARSADDKHERTGIYVAQVGCRFKKQGVQEYELLLATPYQNTLDNGFGWQELAQRSGHPEFDRRKLWAKALWKKDALPTYEEACSDGRYVEVAPDVLLDVVGLEQRLTWVIEPFLFAANSLAGEKQQQAYVHCVGLGLGVWLGDCKTEKGELEVAMQQLKAYTKVLAKHVFPHVAVVDLSWFPQCLGNDASTKLTHLGLQWRDNHEAIVSDQTGKQILIKLSRRNPATPVPEGHLLVAQYAWDGNAFPGNEYWRGDRCASGDSAAACCSTIGELQNPSINPRAFEASKIKFLPALEASQEISA